MVVYFFCSVQLSPERQRGQRLNSLDLYTSSPIYYVVAHLFILYRICSSKWRGGRGGVVKVTPQTRRSSPTMSGPWPGAHSLTLPLEAPLDGWQRRLHDILQGRRYPTQPSICCGPLIILNQGQRGWWSPPPGVTGQQAGKHPVGPWQGRGARTSGENPCVLHVENPRRWSWIWNALAKSGPC